MIGTLDTDRYSLALPWMNAASLVLLWGGSTPPAGYDGAQLEYPDCLRVTAGGLGLWCRAGPQWPGCIPCFRVSIQVAT